MGFGSFISGAISAGVSFISNCVSTVGRAVSSFAKELVIGIPEISIAWKLVTTVVKVIAEELGLIEKEDNLTTEEIGARAVESDKQLEDFSSAEAYIEYLKNEVALDHEKFENMAEEKKLACSAIGVSILSKGIEEKKDIEIPSGFWLEVGKQEMKIEEVKAYIENFKANDMELKMSDYLKGELSVKENKEVAPVIEKTLKDINPQLSDEEIQDKMMDMKEKSRE